MAVMSEERGGRAADTDWALEERFGKSASLLRCTLHTGRTHQIRVHLRSIGHPLMGDAAYGWKADSRLPDPPRVMLHAEHLGVVHPASGKSLDLRAPLPEDFKIVIRALRALEQR